MQTKVSSSKVMGLTLIIGLIVVSIVLFSRTAMTTDSPESVELNSHEFDKTVISNQLGPEIQESRYPFEFDFELEGEKQKTNVHYALHEAAQARMEKWLGQYKPDYASFVAIDARTGRILTMNSYTRNPGDMGNLALKASFPAASIFKVVTASAAIDLNKAEPSTVVPFNGGSYTLYKRNVEDTKTNRWTRYMTMRDAFARSINVFFGKLGLFYVGPHALKSYAERFMFNHPINADIPVETGLAGFDVDDPWSVVQAASGFTKDNTMSPVHGAMIAAAIANDGIMMEPYLVESVTTESGEILYRAKPRQASVVVEPGTATELRTLFQQTVRNGTSRRSFRQTMRRSFYDDVEFGGKTGSLTGDNPRGKCDWFVGYARYRDQRIAVAALTVNEKNWRVKSSTLANLYFEHYLKELKQRELADNNR